MGTPFPLYLAELYLAQINYNAFCSVHMQNCSGVIHGGFKWDCSICSGGGYFACRGFVNFAGLVHLQTRCYSSIIIKETDNCRIIEIPSPLSLFLVSDVFAPDIAPTLSEYPCRCFVSRPGGQWPRFLASLSPSPLFLALPRAGR